MKLQHALLTAAMLTVATSALAQSGPNSTGALAVPANRIVGLWTTVGEVRPCDNPAASPQIIRNTLLFNAGGTMMENPRVLPSVTGGSRSFAIGDWNYDPETGRYGGMLRFDTYLNGVYTGYATVDRDIVLSADGSLASGGVVSIRYDANGNQLSQVCGTAVSTRL